LVHYYFRKILYGWWAALALVALLGIVVTAIFTIRDADGPSPAQIIGADRAASLLLARGKYLTDAADCVSCHTEPNHAPFSGGRVINTSFGGLASSNITPDVATGIGSWTDAQFWRSIHSGISPGRSDVVFPNYLYPAMPFTSYTKLSYDDVMAIKAYLFSLQPVSVAKTPNTLKFPFSQRPLLIGWRMLFFRSGSMRMNPAWSTDVRRGAYLTEALGHCGECHTPRNFMGALIADESLAGAHIDAYYAPNISSDKSNGIGDWSQSDLVSYLFNGGNKDKGSAFGPMGEVVHRSLSQLPKSDMDNIVLYLQSSTAARSTPPRDSTVAALADARNHGATVFAANCAGCHQTNGKGSPPMIPALAGNDSVMARAPSNVIGAVLIGLASLNNGPAMPSFAASLSNAEIAAVANYVRVQWGNTATANATAQDVIRARAITDVPPNAR
jgi:mono/diheme cytochrome c family protein